MPRLSILFATLLAASAASAGPLDVDRIARDAAVEADALYVREGMFGLLETFETCLERTVRSRDARTATACAATGWTMVYLDLLAVEVLHVPPSVDVGRTSTRIAEAMAAAGLPASEAGRLRPYVIQFVGTRSKNRGESAGHGRRT